MRHNAVAIDRELLEVIKSVIPRLPSPQHRLTAEWMIGRILQTGAKPSAEEAAAMGGFCRHCLDGGKLVRGENF